MSVKASTRDKSPSGIDYGGFSGVNSLVEFLIFDVVIYFAKSRRSRIHEIYFGLYTLGGGGSTLIQYSGRPRYRWPASLRAFSRCISRLASREVDQCLCVSSCVCRPHEMRSNHGEMRDFAACLKLCLIACEHCQTKHGRMNGFVVMRTRL